MGLDVPTFVTTLTAMPSNAWNNWFHVTSHTYGTWLPGDSRGWRTRHHRTDAPGDYKHSHLPTELTEGLHTQSRASMTRPVVRLSVEARQVALDAVREAFAIHAIEVAAVCIDDHHLHALIRCPSADPRKWLGIAKKESARTLSTKGLVAPGGVWGLRSHITPIADREHQMTCVRYIVEHGHRGAAVWWVGMDKSPR